MANLIFKSTAQAQEGLKIECSSRTHKFIVDEAESMGGKDNGMNPLETLLCSLGACKCIVAKSFAKLYHINIKDIKVDLEGTLDPEGFMGVNKSAKIGFSKITTKIYIKADNTEEEIIKYVEYVENHCPIQDTLVNSPKLKTEIYL